jgi:NAD(P)-dependent dehydrogenase (short-subunit alcohol dehydrogenase family)
MVKELEHDVGGLTHLVNNAGISQTLPLALIDEADWDQVMDVNVKGAFFTSKAVLRGMIRRRAGVILNVGSVLGLRMIEGPIHYCASKAALRGMTEAMAKEVARYGVRVSCLAPGLLDEGMGLQIPEHRRQDFVQHCALGRPGRLDEVARFAAFLLSDEASYMSGDTIAMDGGL